MRGPRGRCDAAVCVMILRPGRTVKLPLAQGTHMPVQSALPLLNRTLHTNAQGNPSTPSATVLAMFAAPMYPLSGKLDRDTLAAQVRPWKFHGFTASQALGLGP